MALRSALSPDALTIKVELGQDSVAFRRANESLVKLWAKLEADPAVSLKRQLWAQLLQLVYGRDIENDALWFQHTFLVIVAKAIALAVLDVREDDPRRLLSGAAFEAANISGAVESDFFDWVLDDAEGEALVRRVVNHVRRFRLRDVETDVLKVLYESLIDRDERHGLGEYYTPDWLAAKIVAHSVDRPTEQRVLDPACGSGTFLFHAVRLFLVEAATAGMAPERRAVEAADHVAGMDIHPVAVIIARVTYLMALAPVLDSRSGVLSIPVYLGDSLQLSIKQLLGRKELTITVPPMPPTHGAATLEFPDVFCRDPALFDKAIEAIRQGSEQATKQPQIERQLTRIVIQHFKRQPNKEEQDGIADMGKTYAVYDELRRVGRDSVWTYVARNLSRPLALSAGGGRANVLIGNPPWVAFRHMAPDLQSRFKELSQSEQIYVGRAPSQNDLCALFVVRTVALYLRAGGRLAFVMPLAALTRSQFEKFRSGKYTSAQIQFDDAWTMDDSVHPLFPVPSCVLYGRKWATARRTPDTVRAYSGVLPCRDALEAVADDVLAVVDGAPKPSEAVSDGGSVYRKAFRNGATLFPRMLCFVERKSGGRLGVDPKVPVVISRRSKLEKKPYKFLPSIEHKVEVEFIRPILLGESVLPYQVFQTFEGVVPIDQKSTMLNAKAASDLGYAGLAGWMRIAEDYWDTNSKGKMKLVDLFNYHNQLGSQFPIRPLRVVYSKAGTFPAAAIVRDGHSVIENTLYWWAPSTEEEALYLVAILNSDAARVRVANLQARGQFGARHFDKVVFTLAIPRFDANDRVHTDLARLAAEAENLSSSLQLPAGVKFQRARKLVREALANADVSQRIDAQVERLLDTQA